LGLTHLRHLFQARPAVDPSSAQRLARTALSPAIAGCARPAPARSLQLLRAATVGAGELERTPVDVDRPVIVSIAAPPAALRLAHLRPTAVGAGDRGVAREEQSLVGERAQPAEASLRGLLPSAHGTRAALERLVRRLLRVRSLVAAARAPPCTRALETAALATDEVVIDSVRNRPAREEGRDAALAFRRKKRRGLVVQTRPAVRLARCPVPGEIAAAAVARARGCRRAFARRARPFGDYFFGKSSPPRILSLCCMSAGATFPGSQESVAAGSARQALGPAR
jgi:hypothetical protein